MNRATKLDGPYPEFPEEPKLTRRWICRITGKLGGASCTTIGAPFIPGTEPKGACGVVHPPPPPEDEVVLGPDGKPKPKHESLWKKMAREKAEAAAAAGGAPAP